jgi:hypothetical protein
MPIHHTDEYLQGRRRLFESLLAQTQSLACAEVANASSCKADEVQDLLQRAGSLLEQMKGLLSQPALSRWQARHQAAIDRVNRMRGDAGEVSTAWGMAPSRIEAAQTNSATPG